MNSEMLHLAQRVMKNSHPLYQALKTGSPLSAASEIVENLNYLQCAWAYKAVYSNRGDFSFAKHVFEKTPQYRKSPRTSVVPGRWHEPSPTMTDR